GDGGRAEQVRLAAQAGAGAAGGGARRQGAARSARLRSDQLGRASRRKPGADLGGHALRSMKLALFFQLWVELFSTSDRHGNVERAAQLSTLVKQARARSSGPVVLLDAGDLFTGTLESDLGEGAIVIRAMNAIGYDAVAMGNHDFDFGPIGERNIPRAETDDP